MIDSMNSDGLIERHKVVGCCTRRLNLQALDSSHVLASMWDMLRYYVLNDGRNFEGEPAV